MIPKAQSSRIDKDGSCRYIEQQSGNLIETGPKMKDRYTSKSYYL